ARSPDVRTLGQSSDLWFDGRLDPPILRRLPTPCAGYPKPSERGSRRWTTRAILNDRNAAINDLLPIIQELRAKGLTLQANADELTAQGHVTRRGKPWNAMQIARVLSRADAA